MHSHALRTLLQGVGASAYAPYPAPSGWTWDFLAENGSVLTESGQPLIELKRAA